jgi:histone deacetylase 6
MGDKEYLIAFKHVVIPIAEQFQPELIVVSAGFDCALGDPLGGMEVTPDGFAQLTQMLMSVPMKTASSSSSNATISSTSTTVNNMNIPVVFALEGGYNITQISLSIAACIRTLLKLPMPQTEETESFMEISNREREKRRQRHHLFLKDLQEVIRVHKPFWQLNLPQSNLYDRTSS